MVRHTALAGLVMAATAIGSSGQTLTPSERALVAFVGSYAVGEGSVVRIMVRGERLLAESGLGPTTALREVGAGTFEGEGSEPLRLEFTVTDGSEPRLRVKHRGRTRQGQRTAVPLAVLANYVGGYPLSPDLAMVVSSEGGRLIGQATGQSRHPLFPESATTFFVQDYRSEDVAQIEFGSGPEGPFAIFRQTGFEQKVIRK